MPNKADIAFLRQQLWSIDSRLLSLLSERMSLSRQMGRLKQAEGLEVVQPAVAEERLQSLLDEGGRLGLSETFIRRYWEALHAESCKCQTFNP